MIIAIADPTAANPSGTSMKNCVFITVRGFVDYCQSVFFSTEEYSPAAFI
jgi:hypothetical protein